MAIEPQDLNVITMKVNVKLEHNSRGNNWEITVTNADTYEDALDIIRKADEEMRRLYGQ